MSAIPRRAAVALAALPLLLTGKAMLLGRLYGPSDLYFTADPWRRLPEAAAIGAPRNPILSDLAFANLPWRAAVREAVGNGRAPLWNRFVLAGTPLLPAAQAGILHPSTLLSLALPLPLSWTFSCAFTLFLALLCGFLFFRDLELDVAPSLLGACAWGFSTYVVFWIGWSVGPSTAGFPLLLLGLRRLARSPNRHAILPTAAGLWLSVCGGHPESAFHGAAAAAVFFVWELLPARGPAVLRSLGGALAAGALAILLAAPQLFPLLEAVPHSAEYRARQDALEGGGGRQSVPLAQAVARLLPDLLPFAHGIYGKSPVQEQRGDGSGMPLGYAGAVLFPLGALAFATRGHWRRERTIFAAFAIAGLLYGASVPGLIDVTARLPGFALALNYRLVFLAGFGLAGLAALGAQSLSDGSRARMLSWSSLGWAVLLGSVFLLSQGIFRERGLSDGFARSGLALEVVPLLLLAAVAAVAAVARVGALSGSRLAAASLVLLLCQRGAEMAGTYPTLALSTLAPALPTLSFVPLSSEPCRVVALEGTLRPNGSTLYGLEDVRGYESLILDRFTDTYPLWSKPQAASFNLVADLSRPFLSFLNACYAIGAPDAPVPAGWREQARGPEMAIFFNPSALPRAFVPRRLRRPSGESRSLSELSRVQSFAESAWISGAGPAEEENGEAVLNLRAVGPDLVIEAQAASPTLVATSIPNWPGWSALEDGRPLATETVTVNHAFVGFRVPAGHHTIRLGYRPRSWKLGLWGFAAGIGAAVAVSALARAPGREA